MKIEEWITKLDDIYTDKNGYLHIDITLPVCEDNYALYLKYNKDKQIVNRIKELYDLSDYEYVSGSGYVNCYITTVWKKKEPTP